MSSSASAQRLAAADHRLDVPRALVARPSTCASASPAVSGRPRPPLREDEILGVGAEPRRVRRPRPHCERRDAHRRARPRAATEAAATTRSSALLDPAVRRRHPGDPGVRRGAESPRGQGDGTGELCTSRSVTLPSATWPKAPATTTPARSCSRRAPRRARAARRAPTGRCAGRTWLARPRAGWPWPARAPVRAAGRAPRGTPRRCGPSRGPTAPVRRAPTTRSSPAERASMRARCRAALPAFVGRVAHDHRHGGSVLVVDQPDVFVAAEVRVPEAVEEVPDERDGDPDQEHPDRDCAQVLDDPDAAGDRQDRGHREAAAP